MKQRLTLEEMLNLKIFVVVLFLYMSAYEEGRVVRFGLLDSSVGTGTLGPLKEQYVPLTTEISLQPLVWTSKTVNANLI